VLFLDLVTQAADLGHATADIELGIGVSGELEHQSGQIDLWAADQQLVKLNVACKWNGHCGVLQTVLGQPLNSRAES
jgi:hypothetical protein